MNTRKRFGIVASIGCLAMTGIWWSTRLPPALSQQQDQPATEARDDITLREFMRAKLDASNKVLEGLVTEDHDLIREGAQKLNEMTTAERWRVKNDVMYREFSSDFRRTTQQLVDAAEKNNVDQAALRWMDATMSCIECHRYVRGMRVTEIDAGPSSER